jgi:hypothetical protein
VTARVYLHPALLARRAAEIAQSQGGRIGRDPCGRPFVLPAGDPLAAPPAAKTPADPMRFAWLIWVLRALGRPSMEEGEGRFHSRPGGARDYQI